MNSDLEKEVGSIILKQYGSLFKRQSQEFHEVLHKFGGFSKCSTVYPIYVETLAKENLTIVEMVESENNALNKVLAVFSSLFIEVNKLKEEACQRHYKFLALYGQCDDANRECSAQESVSVNMQALCELSAFVKRIRDTLKNICLQIFGLFASDLFSSDGISLRYTIKHISDLLTILITLELLITNCALPDHWSTYCKSIKLLDYSPAKYNLTSEKLKALNAVIQDIDDKINPNKIIHKTLENLLIVRKKLTEKNCSSVASEFQQYLKNAIAHLEKSTIEVFESMSSRKWVQLNAVFLFTSYIFGNTDKKMFKSIVDLNTKAHSVPLYGTVIWYPEQFLQQYLPSLSNSHGKISQTMMKSRQSYIATKKLSIVRDTAVAQQACAQWVLAIREAFSIGNTKLDATQMNRRSQLLTRGTELASQINFLAVSILNLHILQGLPITRAVLMEIFKLLELLKSIQRCIKDNFVSVISSSGMIAQHLSFQAGFVLASVKKALMEDKNYVKQRLDELTALVIAEKILAGPLTQERNVVAHTALTLFPFAAHAEDSYSKLEFLLDKIEATTKAVYKFDEMCDGSLLYFHRNIIPVYLSQVFNDKTEMARIKLTFEELDDCFKFVHSSKTNADSLETFQSQIKSYLSDCILNPLSQQIETNLRLHIHSHLQLDEVNPFTKRTENNKQLLLLDHINFIQSNISVNLSVENYLSNMFYNLTTVVLHDWKTYGEMRQLAKFKFNLETVEDNLPTQTLEQGLDVLEIMRNIHIFVSKYLYNLNNQIFIEQSSNNKHLNSINITHIANSIRTHGTGIMNTTVNFTYQFLRKKFYTFSQFIYDEQIKSRLIKDLRNFRENSSDPNNMYSFKNAEKFNKGIKNLGISEDGQSYLDLFRVLISQIGNAMGYVRMIRSGGRHCCANGTVFLPSLDESLTFKELCERDDLSPLTKESAENLEHTINTLTSSFAHGTEYFQLLVEVFSPVFRNPSNVHLKNFYLIVPPLTLNFVENMILCKDRMTKKNKVGAAFTDDGFVMGLAFILKLLDQYSDLMSLHWFTSVWKHIDSERASLEEQKAKGSVQLQQTLALTEKKINILEEEFQMLYFNFSSARIFFQ